MEIDFLSVEDVLRIHEHQVLRWGGATGLRDMGLLESAVQAPRATFGGRFLNEDLHHMAAAYLYSIIQNHPFIDGNKRSGTSAAAAFLVLNGLKIDAQEHAFTELVMGVAQGLVTKEQVAAFLRENTSPE